MKFFGGRGVFTFWDALPRGQNGFRKIKVITVSIVFSTLFTSVLSLKYF